MRPYTDYERSIGIGEEWNDSTDLTQRESLPTTWRPYQDYAQFPGTREEWEEPIRELFRQYLPERLGTVDSLIDKYLATGSLRLLYDALHCRYVSLDVDLLSRCTSMPVDELKLRIAQEAEDSPQEEMPHRSPKRARCVTNADTAAPPTPATSSFPPVERTPSPTPTLSSDIPEGNVDLYQEGRWSVSAFQADQSWGEQEEASPDHNEWVPLGYHSLETDSSRLPGFFDSATWAVAGELTYKRFVFLRDRPSNTGVLRPRHEKMVAMYLRRPLYIRDARFATVTKMRQFRCDGCDRIFDYDKKGNYEGGSFLWAPTNSELPHKAAGKIFAWHCGFDFTWLCQDCQYRYNDFAGITMEPDCIRFQREKAVHAKRQHGQRTTTYYYNQRSWSHW